MCIPIFILNSNNNNNNNNNFIKIKIQKPINLPIQTLNSIHITPKKKPITKETVNKQNQQQQPISLKHKDNPNNHSYNDIKPKNHIEEIKWEW